MNKGGKNILGRKKMAKPCVGRGQFECCQGRKRKGEGGRHSSPAVAHGPRCRLDNILRAIGTHDKGAEMRASE